MSIIGLPSVVPFEMVTPGSAAITRGFPSDRFHVKSERSTWLKSAATLIQRATAEAPRGHMYYIGLDVQTKTISYSVKGWPGAAGRQGRIDRRELDCWMRTLPQPCTVAMDATIFSGWIYNHLLLHAIQIKMAHRLMLCAIAAAKKKKKKKNERTIRSDRCR